MSQERSIESILQTIREFYARPAKIDIASVSGPGFRQHSDGGKIRSRRNGVLNIPWPLEEDADQQNGARCA